MIRSLFAGRIGRFLKWVLIVTLGLIALAVIVGLIVGDGQDDKTKTNTQLVSPSGVNPDNGRGVKYTVPASRVPRDVEQAEQSASITLTPNRWEEDPNGVATVDVVDVPDDDRQQMVAAIGEFLSQWETFQAGDAATDLERQRYRSQLLPLVEASGVDSVIDRVDNHQPLYICPHLGCNTGQEFLASVVSLDDATQVRAFEGDKAYITTSGAVRYRGGSLLDGDVYYRSYGLVLHKVDGRWLVARAAADTTEQAY